MAMLASGALLGRGALAWEQRGNYADSSLGRIFEGEALSPAVILPTRARRHLRGVYLFHRKPGAPLFAKLELRGEVGQKIGDFMAGGAHLGFAARNINHTGVGVGTHVTFKW